MSDFDTQLEIVFNLIQRKKYSREYLRSLSPGEKIAELVRLQEQYYQRLKIREENGGRPIPDRWRKWHRARFGD
jgi:hypothetical protein